MSSQILAARTVAGCTVSAVLGDLTEQRVDAIVNAANRALAHGGGLAGALVRRGGASSRRSRIDSRRCRWAAPPRPAPVPCPAAG